jgi:hypothetical protein
VHERRKQGVRLHRKGYGVVQIVELSGLSYPTVRSAIDRYEEGGLAVLPVRFVPVAMYQFKDAFDLLGSRNGVFHRSNVGL